MIPTRVGQNFEGGYFTGVIRVGNFAYAIIVAPNSTQVLGLPFKTTNSATENTWSVNDGWANTNSINNSFHPAAQYCCNIASGGYTDWYLPSRDELELCYRNLKPTNWGNDTYVAGTLPGNLSLANGTNLNSIPSGAAYTRTNPAHTIVTAFRTGSVEAFSWDWYWTSTESSSSTTDSLIQVFSTGYWDWSRKIHTSYKVRAVRRVLIEY